MSARTYSTDVYLTCPCPDCEGRKVRITLRKVRSLSRLAPPTSSKSCTSWCPDATTGNSKAKPSSPHPIGKPHRASAANSRSVSGCEKYRPRRRRNRNAGDVGQVDGPMAPPRTHPADSAGQRWAVSMTFRWSRSASRAQSLRPRRRASAEGLHSVRGGHVHSIHQLGAPSSRARPQGSDTCWRQAEFGKGGVRVSCGGGQRIGETRRSKPGVFFRRLARTAARAGTARTALPCPPGPGRLHGQKARESCRRPPRRDGAPGRTTAAPIRGCVRRGRSSPRRIARPPQSPRVG
jgi:hypothetical protein